MKNLLLFLITIPFVSCKFLLTANNADKHSSYSLTYYRRAKADMPPIIVGQVTSSALRERDKPLSGTFFMDGQRLALQDGEHINKYVFEVSSGTHRLQLVTISYYTTEASFRIKPGDSLRIDFQLRPDQRPLY